MKNRRGKKTTTLMLNELKSFVGASSLFWKENKALFSACTGCQRQGRGIVLNRRGCLSAISNFGVSLSQPAETVRGFVSSVLLMHRRPMGEQLDVALSLARLRLPREGGSSGSWWRGGGGAPDSASRGNISLSGAHTRLPTQPLLREPLERVRQCC